MKIPAACLSLLLYGLCLPSSVSAAPLTGESLNVGVNAGVSGSSMTFGAAVGSGNAVVVDGFGSLLVGGDNAVDRAYCSLVVGWSNTGNFDTSLGIGYSNEFNGGIYTFVVGEFNQAGTYAGAIVGINNAIGGMLESAFGQGLINDDYWSSPTLFIGQYNQTSSSADPSQDPPQLFVIGNGTGPAASERANAFEVYLDGRIKMQPQGDISMGEFAP